VQRGDYHTLVTSGFVHADVAHLLFNGFTFWAFGFGLGRHLGTPSFDTDSLNTTWRLAQTDAHMWPNFGGPSPSQRRRYILNI